VVPIGRLALTKKVSFMEGLVGWMVIIGLPLLVVLLGLWATKPVRSRPGHESGRTLRKRFRAEFGRKPDFEGEYLRELKERRYRGGA
jgi:hypothetical protein